AQNAGRELPRAEEEIHEETERAGSLAAIVPRGRGGGSRRGLAHRALSAARPAFIAPRYPGGRDDRKSRRDAGASPAPARGGSGLGDGLPGRRGRSAPRRDQREGA